MTDYTQAIDEFCRTYLEGNAANTGDARTKGPLKENRWARDALDKLLIPNGYRKPEEKAIYVRPNSPFGLDYLFLEDPLKQSEMRFGNLERNHEEQNIIAHLCFTKITEVEKYAGLLKEMGELTKQEAKVKADLTAAERFSKDLVVGGFLVGSMAGMMLYAAAFTYTPLSSFIGEGPTLLGIPFSLIGGAAGGIYLNGRINSYFYNRKSKQAEETSAKLKKDYDRLFQEFKDTFAARFTHGKDALKAALVR